MDYVWGAMSALGNGYLVGYTPGSTVAPTGTDLSAALAGSGFEVGALRSALRVEVDRAGRPLLGTTIDLIAPGTPSPIPFGGFVLGLVRFDPGIDLQSLGMPGCRQYTDATVTWWFGSLARASVVIPAAPALSGLDVFAQAVVYDPAALVTPLGAWTSNGLALHLGTL